MLNFWNWTNDRLPKVAHMFMNFFFQLGCFLALSTRKLHLNVLKPNKNVSVYITECPDWSLIVLSVGGGVTDTVVPKGHIDRSVPIRR